VDKRLKAGDIKTTSVKRWRFWFSLSVTRWERFAAGRGGFGRGQAPSGWFPRKTERILPEAGWVVSYSN